VQPLRITMRHPAISGALMLALLTAPTLAHGSWVKDEVHVDVRSGASSKYRVIGAIGTGDQVDIVSRLEGWTQIRTGTIESGWIPSGHLQQEPPSSVELEKRDRDVAELERRLGAITKKESQIRIAHDELSAREAQQQQEISRLTRETIEARVGARWPEWLTGAGIVLVGMILGSVVSRGSNRRQHRIKL
jgi:uncharacterized protein YgiM (DUF1202 family)